jgi:hypothetical protein
MDFENDYEPSYYDELERDWDEAYEPECVTGCDPEEYEDDWDGQPDEAQEWYDYDPDC